MAHYLDNPDIFEKVISLSKSEQQDPLKVIDGIYTGYSLSGLRKNFLDLVDISLCADSDHFRTPLERENLLTYRDEIVKLFDAAFILRERYKNARTNRPLAPIVHFFRSLRPTHLTIRKI